MPYTYECGNHSYAVTEQHYANGRGVDVVIRNLPPKTPKGQKAKSAKNAKKAGIQPLPTLTNNTKSYKFNDETQPHEIDSDWYHTNQNYNILYQNCCIAIAEKMETTDDVYVDNRVVNWPTPIRTSRVNRHVYTLDRQ